MDYLSEFIVTAGKVSFETSDGRAWLMRQPTPDEDANGKSAFRLAYDAIMADERLGDLAKDQKALEREAAIRANSAEVLYMIPVLLETGEGRPAFDIFDSSSLAEFEILESSSIMIMVDIFLGPVQEAIREAKKKLLLDLSDKSKLAKSPANGRIKTESSP